MKENILNPNEELEDEKSISFRPCVLNKFIGQNKLKENLNIFIQASKMRQKPIDHILFYGPPGLGKTTLANIIAQEMNVGFRLIAAPMLTKNGDLAAILTNLKQGDVLFIDEIHRLHASIEETLYSAMEDFRLDIIIGDGPAARIIKIDLQHFTLVGATTKIGSISAPLRTRFGIPMQIDFYTQDELREIVIMDAKLIDVKIDQEGAQEIAKRSRGTPRIAIRMLKRTADFAIYNNHSLIDRKISQKALNQLGVDDMGFDISDRKYLNFLTQQHSGKAVGIDTIAAGIGEDVGSIEDTIEPYLLRNGFIEKTPKGRIVTKKAIEYVSNCNVKT